MPDANVKYTLLATSEIETDIMSSTEKPDDLSLVIRKDNDLLQTSTTMKQKNESKRGFYENITTVVHLILFQYVIFILYLSFSHEVELFIWHPILLSVGWSLLMTEAIIALSPENCLTKLIPLQKRIFLHWMIQSTAAICILAGFIIVIVNKNSKNKEHFKTWHAIFGLVSIIFCVPTCLNGILTLYKVELRQYVDPILSKFIHICSGCATFILGIVTLILSSYSNWFMKKTGYTSQVICVIALVFIGVWVLIRPTKYLLKKGFR